MAPAAGAHGLAATEASGTASAQVTPDEMNDFAHVVIDGGGVGICSMKGRERRRRSLRALRRHLMTGASLHVVWPSQRLLRRRPSPVCATGSSPR
jgi:hypothetical protein